MAEWPENKLYVQWLESAPADRWAVEEKLYPVVKRHVRSVLWNKLNEDPPDELVDKATAEVMTQLARFRRKCKFSTWVQEIAQRSAKQYIRGKVRARKVFDEYTAVIESDSDDALDSRAGEITPSVIPHLEGEIAVKEFRQSLSKEDAALLQHKEEGLESKEIAEKTESTVDAVYSRWARLKQGARNVPLKPKPKKIRVRRRK